MTRQDKAGGRWLIAAMGTLLTLCLGTIYAWSYFQDLLVREFKALYHWSNVDVAWVFSLAIFFLGAAAALGGRILPRFGPRRLALLGAGLFGAGYLVSGLALSLASLPLLYIGMGVVGGTGLGLSYVTPVATVSRWFPDRKGLATGMVVMGFGLGALLMSKILAPVFLGLEARDLPRVFRDLGLVLGVLSLVGASFLRNPPTDWAPPARQGQALPRPSAQVPPHSGAPVPTRSPLLSRDFILIWLVFFCNITAGIALIGFQSPLLQDLLRKGGTSLSAPALAALGATLIAISSLFNGGGRLLWGALIDRLGGAWTYRIMLGGEILAFAGLLGMSLGVGMPLLFGALVCYVLLCYGGGFGAMPAFIGEVFGTERMAAVYGAVLTAWSVAGIVGPQIVAGIKDRWPSSASTLSFAFGLGLLVLGFGLSWLLPGRGLRGRASAKA